MKGRLEYSPDGEGFNQLGLEMTRKEQEYTVEPVTDNDRSGNPVVVGYEVTATGRFLSPINGPLLTASEWYFRIFFPEENKQIPLGFRKYQIEYDGLIDRNSITYFTVKVNFLADISQFTTLTTPADPIG